MGSKDPLMSCLYQEARTLLVVQFSRSQSTCLLVRRKLRLESVGSAVSAQQPRQRRQRVPPGHSWQQRPQPRHSTGVQAAISASAASSLWRKQ